MPIGSLRRSVGVLGLLALVPVAGMLLVGAVTPADAVRRAVAAVVVLLVLGRLATYGVRSMAAVLEAAPQAPSATDAAGDEPAEPSLDAAPEAVAG